MMRLRRASVIATLSLLASTTTASAECAWVLWSYLSDTRAGLVERYDPNSAQATRQECDEAVRRKAADLKKKGWDVEGGFPGSYEVLGTQGTKMWRYVCLPDTVDPRGPKGK